MVQYSGHSLNSELKVHFSGNGVFVGLNNIPLVRYSGQSLNNKQGLPLSRGQGDRDIRQTETRQPKK